MRKTNTQSRTIDFFVNHYTNSGEFPQRMSEIMDRVFQCDTPYASAGVTLLESAAKHGMVKQVGNTLSQVVRHSTDYLGEFFAETRKLMAAYRNHNDLPHVLAVGYGHFFEKPEHFSTMAHAFDGTAVTQALKMYHNNGRDYKTLAHILWKAAEVHRTASPLGAMAQALTQPEVINLREEHQNNQSYPIISFAIMQTAALTGNKKVTASVADVAYRHINDEGMHFILDSVTTDARKAKNPGEYLLSAIESYDGNSAPAKLRRYVHMIASKVLRRRAAAA